MVDASKLYPDMQPPDAPEAEGKPDTPHADSGQQQSPAELLYGGTKYATVDVEPLASALDIPHETRDEFATETHETLGRMGLSDSEANQLLTHIAAGLNNPPDDKQLRRWEDDAVGFLKTRNQYRDSWKAELQEMRRFLDGHPEVKQLLNRSGAGSRREVMEVVLAAARRQRVKG